VLNVGDNLGIVRQHSFVSFPWFIFFKRKPRRTGGTQY